jgi:prevent-host-death family protein
MATPREIPQRELRNRIGEVLREVEAGAHLRVTVSGRPVAELTPLRNRSPFAPRATIERLLSKPVDGQLARDIEELRADDAAVDPWEGDAR